MPDTAGAHAGLEPGLQAALRILDGTLAGHYRAAVVGSDRRALYLCVLLPDERAALPQGSRVRVSLPVHDPVLRDFESRIVFVAASGPGQYLAVAWPATGGRERRRHLRQRLVLPAVLETLSEAAAEGDDGSDTLVNGGAGAVRLPGVVYDLSLGGASVHCRNLRARKGDVLRLSLRLPGGKEAWEVSGQVKWVRAAHSVLGLEFVDASPALGDELRRVIGMSRSSLLRAVGARLLGVSPEDVWPRKVQGVRRRTAPGEADEESLEEG
jgi:hypothetical protein